MNHVISLGGNLFHEARKKQKQIKKVIKWAEYCDELSHLQLQIRDCFAFDYAFYLSLKTQGCIKVEYL